MAVGMGASSSFSFKKADPLRRRGYQEMIFDVGLIFVRLQPHSVSGDRQTRDV